MDRRRQPTRGLQARLNRRRRFHLCFTRFTQVSRRGGTMGASPSNPSIRCPTSSSTAARRSRPHQPLANQTRAADPVRDAADPTSPCACCGVPDITDVRKILDSSSSAAEVYIDFEDGIARHASPRHRLRRRQRPTARGDALVIMLVPPLLARFGAARIEDDVRAARWACARSTRMWRCSSASAAVERRRRRVDRAAPRPLDATTTGSTTPPSPPPRISCCAALASGTSTLTNAACEPHVQEFCTFMAMLGVRSTASAPRG